MQDQILFEFLQRMCNSLENIDKTLAEPKNLSAHRVAANRRISKAMDYIAEATIQANNMCESETSGSPYPTFTYKPVRKLLDDIREILCARM